MYRGNLKVEGTVCESGSSCVVAKQEESLKRNNKWVRLQGNGKESKEGKFPYTKNCKKKKYNKNKN